MKTIFTLLLVFSLQAAAVAQNDSWIELFSGKNLDGWKFLKTQVPFRLKTNCSKSQALEDMLSMWGRLEMLTLKTLNC